MILIAVLDDIPLLTATVAAMPFDKEVGLKACMIGQLHVSLCLMTFLQMNCPLYGLNRAKNLSIGCMLVLLVLVNALVNPINRLTQKIKSTRYKFSFWIVHYPSGSDSLTS